MGHRVLLADDSITVQKIVKLSLSEEGIEVIAFGNGEEAVQQIESLQPDLIMADVFMPGKDGYEVCEYVKAHPHLNQTPVILLVHAFEPFDPERAKKVNADHQLTKPFQSIRTLVSTVQELLNKPKQPAAVMAAEAVPALPIVEPGQVVDSTASAVMAQPMQEEEIAFSPASIHGFSSEKADGELMPMPSFVAPAPMPVAVPPPSQVIESAFPSPPPILNSFSGSDFFPPLDLPEIPTTAWQPIANTDLPESLPQTISVMPTPPVAVPSFAGFAPRSTPDVDADDDVLGLSEVLPEALPPVQAIQAQPSSAPAGFPIEAATSAQFNAAALSPGINETAPIEMGVIEPVPTIAILPALPESNQHSFTSGLDLGIGQMIMQPSVSEVTPPVQDLQTGTLSGQAGTGTMEMSEAMIEEIVNRVVQRLSTRAIQEIAWEVVPEMAELMIRKQMAQQQQLSH